METPQFFCCRAEQTEPARRQLEPTYKPPAAPILLWKLQLLQVRGLQISAGTLVFKASYSGRSMYSDPLRLDDCEDIPLDTRYVFKDVAGCDDVSVELFETNSKIGQLVIPLASSRTEPGTSDELSL